jgi:hypothetical protein
MDKYDTFIIEVIKKTQSGDLKWQIEDPSYYASLIPEFTRIIQVYSTNYKQGYKNYQLLFVEKTSMRYIVDFDIEREEFSTELLVFKDGKRIFTLDTNFVESDSLRTLRSLLATENTDTAEFFSEFEAGG